MKQYVVKVDIQYIHVTFTFGSIQGACNFMDLFLDHLEKVGDAKNANVRLERIDLPEKEESEDK